MLVIKNCHIWKEKFKNEDADDKKYCVVRDQCHYAGKNWGAAERICNLRSNMAKTIHWYEYRANNKSKKSLQKIFFQVSD